MRTINSIKVTKCINCGSLKLNHIDIDPETLDDSAEWDQFLDGYECGDCGQISHQSEDGAREITIVSTRDVIFNKTSEFGSDNASASYVSDQEMNSRQNQPA